MADADELNELARAGDVEGVRTWLQTHEQTEFALAKQRAFFLAASMGHAEIVRAFIMEGGVSVDARDASRFRNSALTLVARLGYTNVARVLITDGRADVNGRNDQGCTALMYAASQGHTDLVRLLLEDPALDIHMQNTNGSTAFYVAALSGREEIMSLLVEHGASAAVTNPLRTPVVIVAAQYGHSEILRVLLEHDLVNVNQQNENGVTSLLAAVQSYPHYPVHIVRMLLQMGHANCYITSAYGKCAFSESIPHRNSPRRQEIAKLLIEHNSEDWSRWPPLPVVSAAEYERSLYS